MNAETMIRPKIAADKKMKPFYEVMVVIPVGPNSSHIFIADTINSFIYYTRSSYKIIIADDSQQQIGLQVKKSFPDIDIVCTAKPMGWLCGLYINLSLAYKHALENYRFNLLLKLDTDALVIGTEPEKDAKQFFENNTQVGIAGQYPYDYHGHPWDTGWPRRRILNGTRTWKFIKRPFANWELRKLYTAALKNGYKTGESVFGGAYFMTRAMLEKLHEENLLPYYKLRTLNLGEDHLFGLLAKASGFHLGDLSAADLPFGCAWKGLPVSPEQLCKDGKKIIHSVRYWQNMK